MEAYQTELDCIHCGKTTNHTVVYASSYIKSIRCNYCHHSLEKSTMMLLWCYSHDLPERSFALTRRLKNEAQSHPFSFAMSLPRRMVYKPIEVFREIADLCFA